MSYFKVKFQSFLIQIRNMTKMFPATTAFQRHTVSATSAIRPENVIKVYTLGKKEQNTMFTDDMIVHGENLRESVRTTTETHETNKQLWQLCRIEG